MGDIDYKRVDSIDNYKNELPKVLFVHSNPIVEGIPLLDYFEEESIIKKCCIDSKLAIRFSSEVGTVKALSSSLIHGANIIHYSGHGDQNYIIFEKENGDMHCLDAKSLESILNASGMALQCSVVFVSACYSEEVGKRFIAAGVKHVICVKQTEMISDSSSLTFAKLFYTALFQGKSVRVAFDIAVKTVIADEASSRHIPGSIANPTIISHVPKFILLPIEAAHDDVIINPRNMLQGSFIDESESHTINQCDKPPSKFVSRNVELQQAFTYLCSSRPRSRFVSVEGECGIGKTAFVCRLAQYISERGMYDEICFLPLSRMIRQYENNTHGDHNLQLGFLINRFATSLSSYHEQEIDSLDDLIAILDVDSMRYRTHSRNSHSWTNTSLDYDLLSASALTNTEHISLPSASSFSSPSHSYRRILYILDGCESYTDPHSSASYHGESDDITSDHSDNDSSTTTGSINSNNTLHPPALILLIDAILRRTTHVNFLLTNTRRLSASTSFSAHHRRGHDHISEPEKLIVLKSLSDMKMVELFRKVVPRPLTFTELGITPATSSNANDILSKQPWMSILHGNPRAMIYFVRHLSEIQLNDMVAEEMIEYAKRAYDDAIHYRNSSSSMLLDAASDRLSMRRDNLRSLSEVSLPALSRSISDQSYISHQQPISSSSKSYHDLFPIPSSSLSDPTLWRTWIDTLAQNAYTNMFTTLELSLRLPDQVYLLSRQLSENDRIYLYSAFISKITTATSLSSSSSTSSIVSPSPSSRSQPSIPTTTSVRLSTSTIHTPASSGNHHNYHIAQELYLLWWNPLLLSLKRFRCEFMCCYPIVIYGYCSRDKAEQLLLEENKPGLFLIRFSESSNDGSLVLTSLLPATTHTVSTSAPIVVESSSARQSQTDVNFDELGCLEASTSSPQVLSTETLTSSSSSQHHHYTNNLRIYHHELQVSDHGIALSFRDRRNTYSSLKLLLERSDSLRILYPDIMKADLLALLQQLYRR